MLAYDCCFTSPHEPKPKAILNYSLKQCSHTRIHIQRWLSRGVFCFFLKKALVALWFSKGQATKISDDWVLFSVEIIQKLIYSLERYEEQFLKIMCMESSEYSFVERKNDPTFAF